MALSAGPAGAYALLSLLHAAVVERNLTVDIGFGRSLAFWTVGAMLALLAWGFLPRHPSGRFARRGFALGLLGVGGVGLLVCGGFTVAWLAMRWNGAIGWPVVGALAAMILAALATLRIADRAEPD